MRRSLSVLALASVSSFSMGQYAVFAAETYSGSLGGNTSLYGNVQRYDIPSPGGFAITGTFIPASQLHDPGGMLFANGKLYVGNRYGNTLGQGGVQEFAWNGISPTGGATIASAYFPAAQGFHGFNFAPNGELFVSTVNSGTRRYHDYGSGFWDVSGTASGAVRDAWISPDGQKLWETTIGNTIVVTNILSTGFGSSSTFTVGGSNAMHQMSYHGGDIYVTSFNSGTVHKVTLDAQYNPVSSTTILNVPAAIGIASSPNGQELFVSGHTSNTIYRYLLVSGQWVSVGTIPTNCNMGYLAIAPEPGVARIKGTVSLGDFSRSLQGETLTAEVWNGNSLVETLTTSIGSGEVYGINPSETNVTRTIRLWTRSGLKKSVTLALTNTAMTGINVALTNGDVDNSGEVDAADIDAVISQFGSTTAVNSDVDGSGEVDAADIDIVIARFGSVDG